jgi:hypothetical protein
MATLDLYANHVRVRIAWHGPRGLHHSEFDADHVRVPALHGPRGLLSAINTSTFTPICTFASGAANFASSHLLSLLNESVILFESLATKTKFARHIVDRLSYNSTATPLHDHDLSDLVEALYTVRLVVRRRVPDVREPAGSEHVSYPARLACASRVATVACSQDFGHSLSFALVHTFATGVTALISPTTSALHANNLIVEFALLLDGLFTKHALALHDSLSQPVFAAEDLMSDRIHRRAPRHHRISPPCRRPDSRRTHDAQLDRVRSDLRERTQDVRVRPQHDRVNSRRR